jgi:hypothetical protein
VFRVALSVIAIVAGLLVMLELLGGAT